ncbi:MAG: AzlC family ABC transporter permease [Burkholderiaceae bacterium]
MLIGTLPFGLIFGGLAGSAGLSAGQASGMSALVFAGSAQFIAINLLAGGATVAVLLLTTFMVNLRHALYSASLQPHVRHLPQRWRIALAFLLTDEAFAVVQHRYAEPDPSPHKHWYFLGAALTMYVTWQLSTALGIAFGLAIPNLAAWGLDFAMLATFIGIVVPMLKNRPQLAAALVAGAVALACQAWPYKLGLMAAAASGITVGVWLERRQRAATQEAA